MASTDVKIGLLDMSSVFPVARSACGALDAFRTVRQPTSQQGRRFTALQSNWELALDTPPCTGRMAKPVVEMEIGDPSKNFTLVGMDGSGKLQQIFADREHFDRFRASNSEWVSEVGDDSYQSIACVDNTGLVGQLLLTGQRPFPLQIPDAEATSGAKGQQVDAAWIERFKTMARQRGWKAEMVWYRVVNDTPD